MIVVYFCEYAQVNKKAEFVRLVMFLQVKL